MGDNPAESLPLTGRFHEHLRPLRERMRLYQFHVAQRLNVSLATWCNYEKGTKEIPLEIAEDFLAMALPDQQQKQNDYRSLPGYPPLNAQQRIAQIEQELKIPLGERGRRFGDLFRALRTQKGLAQKDLAQERRISDVEAGDPVALEEARQIILKLGIAHLSDVDAAFYEAGARAIRREDIRRKYFGEALYAMRNYARPLISQERLARAMDCDATLISLYERTDCGPRHVPDRDMESRIIRYLEKKCGGQAAIDPALKDYPTGWDTWVEVEGKKGDPPETIPLFYVVAEAIREAYPDRCERVRKSQKAPPEAVEFYQRLGALLKAMDIQIDTFATQCSITKQVFGRLLRNNPPADAAKHQEGILGVLGVDAKEFEQLGEAAHHIVALRERCAKNLGQGQGHFAISAIGEEVYARGLDSSSLAKKIGRGGSTLRRNIRGTTKPIKPWEFADAFGIVPATNGPANGSANGQAHPFGDIVKEGALYQALYDGNGPPPDPEKFALVDRQRQRLLEAYPDLKTRAQRYEKLAQCGRERGQRQATPNI